MVNCMCDALTITSVQAYTLNSIPLKINNIYDDDDDDDDDYYYHYYYYFYCFSIGNVILHCVILHPEAITQST